MAEYILRAERRDNSDRIVCLDQFYKDEHTMGRQSEVFISNEPVHDISNNVAF